MGIPTKTDGPRQSVPAGFVETDTNNRRLCINVYAAACDYSIATNKDKFCFSCFLLFYNIVYTGNSLQLPVFVEIRCIV